MSDIMPVAEMRIRAIVRDAAVTRDRKQRWINRLEGAGIALIVVLLLSFALNIT